MCFGVFLRIKLAFSYLGLSPFTYLHVSNRRAFLRPRENLRQVAERFAGGQDHLRTFHRLLSLIEGPVISVLVGLSNLLSFLFQQTLVLGWGIWTQFFCGRRNLSEPIFKISDKECCRKLWIDRRINSKCSITGIPSSRIQRRES